MEVKGSICFVDHEDLKNPETLEEIKQHKHSTLVIGAGDQKKSIRQSIDEIILRDHSHALINMHQEEVKQHLATLQMVEDFKYSDLTRAQREAVIVPVRTEPKIGRNEACPCGSGRKYKHCCSHLENV